jgi:cytochrome P450/NADPH-cytochrome P450 reductase
MTKQRQAVIREAMRLQGPVTLRTVSPIEDTTICGGKYSVKADATIWVLTAIAHRDPQVFGEDVRQFVV